MLELFHETKDFYQLKELEKLCSKQKGIGSFLCPFLPFPLDQVCMQSTLMSFERTGWMRWIM
jgi:hypothetical protein